MRMMEMVVTTGATRRAKLQQNYSDKMKLKYSNNLYHATQQN